MDDKFIIPLNGLATGKNEFSWKVGKEFFESFDNTEVIDAELDAEVVVEKSGRYIGVDCDVFGSVMVECDRCLDELEYPIETSDTLYVKFSEEEIEFDGEVMWLNPADEEINLAGYIYESLLLALPYQRVHESVEDCNPEMIGRFSIVSEEEFNEIAEPKEQSMASGESGAALAALKRSLEEQKQEN